MLRRGARPQIAAPPAFPRPRRPLGPPAEPVEVDVEVEVDPATALSYFCDAARWVRFQGRTANLDPRPGGRLRVDLGDGVVMAGRYTQVVPGEHVAFSWGQPGDPAMPEGSSTVLVEAAPHPSGCTLRLVHSGLPDRAMADAHRSGWRYHLRRLAVAAAGATGDDETVDLFLAAASEPDGAARRGLLERSCTPRVMVADAVGTVSGVPALDTHLLRGLADATDRARLERNGAVERLGMLGRCRYSSATAPDAGELALAFDPGSRLRAVSFFAAPTE